jgi:hypothetical protein
VVWNWFYFGFGALGAIAPEVARLYKLATDKEQFTWSWFYVIISLIFAAIGGVIAVILPAMNFLSAIYAGAAWPALITTGKQIAGSGQEVAGQKAIKGGGGPGPAPPPSFGSFIRAL